MSRKLPLSRVSGSHKTEVKGGVLVTLGTKWLPHFEPQYGSQSKGSVLVTFSLTPKVMVL